MFCYFDNAATTRVYDQVADEMCLVMKEKYGNPSSLHSAGLLSEHLVRDSAALIADSLKVTEKEILFTSGGTESNNTALFGVAETKKREGNHVIVSAVEHPSVSRAAEQLEKRGFKVSRLPVDDTGVVKLPELEAMLRENPDTILVSVMLVNNEVGAVQPAEKISGLIKKYAPKALFHIDAVQAYGKLVLRPKRLGADLLSASGHKFHGPKGVGFLYIRNGVRLAPMFYGGGQQKGLRSGTQDVYGIYGMSLAAKEALRDCEVKTQNVRLLAQRLAAGIGEFPGTVLHSKYIDDFPYIVSASFTGIRSEVLLHALDERGICVSSGSACATNDRHVSDTLTAMGVNAELIDSAVRFSFSEDNDISQADHCLECLRELVPRLREVVRR